MTGRDKSFTFSTTLEKTISGFETVLNILEEMGAIPSGDPNSKQVQTKIEVLKVCTEKCDQGWHSTPILHKVSIDIAAGIVKDYGLFSTEDGNLHSLNEYAAQSEWLDELYNSFEKEGLEPRREVL